MIPPDVEPSIILANGSKFAKDHGYKPAPTVPTCGIDGEEIPSEVVKPTSN